MARSGSDPAVRVLNHVGKGRVVLICEHASNHIPAEYQQLGLSDADVASHAAWDPGALDLALQLSRALDGLVIAGAVSRLVYDCNRPPDAPSAFPAKSELIETPGNRDLSPAQKAARTAQVYDPFCAAVSGALDERGADAVVVTVHSFTPVYFGEKREVEIGLLHDADSRLVDAMLHHAEKVPHRVIERNAPYGPEDGVTHTLQRDALPRGLQNVMIEVRNDLLASPAMIAQIAQDILTLLEPALDQTNTKEPASWQTA